MNKRRAQQVRQSAAVAKAMKLSIAKPDASDWPRTLPPLPSRSTLPPIVVKLPRFETPRTAAEARTPTKRSTTYDPDADALHVGAKKTYLAANDDYRAISGHEFSYIEIHSGLRTVKRQADLYDEFMASKTDGLKANPANKPGKSLHNYGLAIDIVRGNDELRLRTALEANDWENTVNDEGWHFEPTGIPDYHSILSRIRSEVVPIADEYGETRSDYYSFDKHIRADKPKYDAERARLATLRPKLVKERKVITRRRAFNKKVHARLSKTRRKLLTEQAKLKSLRAKANQPYLDAPKGYTCPNGYDLPDCNHKQEKQNYRKRKARLSRQAGELAASIVQQQRTYQSDLSKYKRENAAIKRLVSSYQKRQKAYDRDLRKNKRLGRKLHRNIRLQRLANGKKAGYLLRIEAAVNKIRKGEIANALVKQGKKHARA